MDRRETLKTLLISTVGGGAVATGVVSCKTEPETIEEANVETQIVDSAYGRTPAEKARDEALQSETFFTEHELATIAVLCDIILPADELSPSATEVEVPVFIEFIAKDLPYHQLPLRGGIMWLDHESKRRYENNFKELSDTQQIAIVDDIAWADKAEKFPQYSQGIQFFDKLRNLTLTGFYTSKMGIQSLGYAGNRPNIWDGVPAEVLAKHDVDYDEEWLAKCIDQDTREAVATWDEEGNLLT
ncbi:MAG: gluconate 2-dehydrogenase subunit 3 family protein [Bacteroidota bacterium]